MGIKYQCDIPGFEDCWFELSERWTRGEHKAFYAETGEKYLDLVRRKLTGIHMTTETGVIDTPDALTMEVTDSVDIMLWKWFATALNVGLDELHSMGEAHARRWSGEYAKLTDERRAKAKPN